MRCHRLVPSFAVCWLAVVGTMLAARSVDASTSSSFLVRQQGRRAPLLSVNPKKTQQRSYSSWQTIPRGGADDTPATTTKAKPQKADSKTANSPQPPSPVAKSAKTGDATASSLSLATIASQAVKGVGTSLKGGKSDTLLLLAATALVPTLCSLIQASPILGFLGSGLALGPQGLNWISDLHMTELLADLGVVLFLFEMGVHLSLKTLWDMRAIVFGLGGAQMLLTGGLVALVARLCGLSTAAQVVLGGGLALSSSAFVLQILKDNKELETSKGKHSFGVLLLQDLAVVPLLVVTPLLASTGDTSVTTAVIKALVQFSMALVSIALFGTLIMPPLFKAVLTKAHSQEATIAVSLATILGMSFLTEGLGLSNTLGAFLAGVLLSETPFRHTVEKEVSPFRGILVGLFFFSVGFELDLPLLFSGEVKKIAAIVFGLMGAKTVITTGLCKAFGLDFPTSQQVGFLLSQGGEFGFVAFRLARSLKILDEHLTKIMLTSVSLTMALTPLVEGIGSFIAAQLSKTDDKKKK